MIKIKSETDVITNSSSEVFTYVSKESVEKLKAIINSILEISGSSKKCDDCFKIEPVIRDRGSLIWEFEDEFERQPENEDELISYAWDQHNEVLRVGEGHPVFREIKLIPLSGEYLKAAEIITSNINQIYMSDEFYC